MEEENQMSVYKGLTDVLAVRVIFEETQLLTVNVRGYLLGWQSIDVSTLSQNKNM